MAVSAGLLVHRRGPDGPEVLLGHPGGPFWKNRDLGWWTIPKGLIEGDEPPLAAAIREFREETGLDVSGDFRALTPLRQKGGKRVHCWAVEADLDLKRFSPGEFELEWPPRSGRTARFPEIDRVQYFPPTEALSHILPSQAPLVVEALLLI